MKFQFLFLTFFLVPTIVGCQTSNRDLDRKNLPEDFDKNKSQVVSSANQENESSAESSKNISQINANEKIVAKNENNISHYSIVKFSNDDESVDNPTIDEIEDSESLNNVDDSILAENPDDFLLDSLSDKSNPLMCNDGLFYDSWVTQFNNQWLAKNAKHYKKKNARNKALAQARMNEFINLVYPAIEKTGYDFPVVINPQVLSWIGYFTGAGRKNFMVWLERGQTFIPEMQKTLERKGLPSDLVYLSMIESGYSQKALSYVGAVGLWQFMPGTAKEYGLKMNDYLDERRNSLKSTEAASNYLSDLYSQFGSWHLAAASYNVGPGSISKKLRNYGEDSSFFDLTSKKRINSQTANYVPKILAAMIIAKNASLFGFDTPQNYEVNETKTMSVNRSIALSDLAKSIQVDPTVLEALNPELRLGITPPSRFTSNGSYELNVPANKLEMAIASLNDLPNAPTNHLVAARIKRSEKVAAFAKRYKLAMASLLNSNNNLKSTSSLKKGQVVYISVTLGTGQYDRLTTVKYSKHQSHKKYAHTSRHKSKKALVTKTKKHKPHRIAYKDK